MTDENPYAPPQVPLVEARPFEPPQWLADVFWLQLECYGLCIFLTFFTVTPDSQAAFRFFYGIAVGITGLLSLLVLGLAVRLRLGLIVTVELSLALPCLVWLACQQRLLPGWW